jgi:hypothetical protein
MESQCSFDLHFLCGWECWTLLHMPFCTCSDNHLFNSFTLLLTGLFVLIFKVLSSL